MDATSVAIEVATAIEESVEEISDCSVELCGHSGVGEGALSCRVVTLLYRIILFLVSAYHCHALRYARKLLYSIFASARQIYPVLRYSRQIDMQRYVTPPKVLFNYSIGGDCVELHMFCAVLVSGFQLCVPSPIAPRTVPSCPP